MIGANGHLVTNVPLERAFDWVADLRNEPLWNPSATNVELKTDDSPALGTVFEEDVKPLGHYVVTISEYDRPTRLEFDAQNPKARVTVRFDFRSLEQRETRIDGQLRVTLIGAMRFIEPVLRPMIRRDFESKRGPALKSALEQHA